MSNFIGAQKMIHLFDDDNDGTADTTIIAAVLSRTDEILNTLDLTSAEKTMAAYDIATYLGHYRRNMHQAYEARYNYWLTFRSYTVTSKPCWDPEEKPVDTNDGWFDQQTDNISYES